MDESNSHVMSSKNPSASSSPTRKAKARSAAYLIQYASVPASDNTHPDISGVLMTSIS